MELLGENEYPVLSSEFIKDSYLKRQCTDEVARLISLEPEFDWETITELDLSQLNVVHILGLRLVTNLRRLRLAQNHIERIENVGWLTRLEHLDLSFNRITKIENLETLTALTLLNLGGNRITALENLDENVLLETFVVSDNRIADVEQFFYMKRFQRLRFMDVENNPAAAGARQRIVDQFPGLLYLDTVRITDAERPEPRPAGEVGGGGGYNDKRAEVERLAFLSETDGERFFDRLYEDDVDGRVLAKWNGEVQAAFAAYGRQITEAAVNVCDASLKNLMVRDERKFAFHLAYHRFERKWTISIQKTLKEFEEIRNIRMRSIGENIDKAVEKQNNGNVGLLSVYAKFDPPETLTLIFKEELFEVTNRMCIYNIYMNKSILAMINVYEKILDDELKTFVECLDPMFFNMHQIKNDYLQVLSECVKFDVNNPHKILPKQITDHFEDRFDMVQAVYKSNDKHADIIYKREEDIKSDAKKWNKTIIEELQNSERQRFMMVWEEIKRYREQSVIYLETLMVG